MPIIYHEGYSLGDGAGNNQLLKDTVGWTGKNLLKNTATSQTINGVTFTVNADGSVTANGTATADAIFVVNDNFVIPTDNYILSTHEISDGNNIHYSVVKMPGNTVLKEVKGTDEQPFTVNYSDYSYLKFTIWVRSGTTVSNKTAYPMIRRADITDPTYEPYHESVEEEIEQIYADNGVLGAKNLLENTASTTTVNGVTFTVNADKSVTVNGTATADATIKITPNSSLRSNLKEGISYILSGCPGGGSSSTYALQYSNNTNNVKYDTGSGVEFVDYDRETYPNVSVYVLIRSGVTASNLTFKPMIRLASDPDDTYQPYAMTNRELTDAVSVEPLTINLTASDKATKLRDDSRRCGNVVNIRIQLQVTAEIANNTEIFRLNGLPHVGYAMTILGETNTGEIIPMFIVNSSGSVVVYCRKAIPTGYYAISYTYVI